MLCSLRASVFSSLVSARPLSTAPVLLKGHSKWQNIKATKGKNDLIRSQAMNALLKKVSAAVRRGGFDLKINSDLAALEKEFKAQGLGLDTFKNYLQKLKDKPEQFFRFELIGPSGSFFIIEAEGANKSGITSSIQKYLNKVGGFRIAADSSAVLTWFDEKGVILTETTNSDGKEISFEQAEEVGIECDCEQVEQIDVEGSNKYELICEPQKLSKVENAIKEKSFVIVNSEVEMRAKHPIALGESESKLVEKLYGFLQEDESIRQIYDNLQLD